MFKSGINVLEENFINFSSSMPNLDNVSQIIKNRTGWQIKTVAGFVDEVIFFELLSNKYFPSSDIIRLSSRFYDKYFTHILFFGLGFLCAHIDFSPLLGSFVTAFNVKSDVLSGVTTGATFLSTGHGYLSEPQ